MELLLLCQTTVPTLPTIQLKHKAIGQRFRCVKLVAADVASSRDGGVNPEGCKFTRFKLHTPRFLSFLNLQSSAPNDAVSQTLQEPKKA